MESLNHFAAGAAPFILHLFPYEKFTNGTVNLLNAHFGPAGHLYVVYGHFADVELRLDCDANVLRLPNLLDMAKPAYRKRFLAPARRVVVHSLSGPAAQLLLLAPSVLKKTVIAFWGYEIYGLANPKGGLRGRVYNWSIRREAARAAGVGVLLPSDAEALAKQAALRGKVYPVSYFSGNTLEKLLAYKPAEKPPSPALVLLGNNANRSNLHIEALERLAAYKNEALRVVTPLSYGEKDNVQPVVDAGRRLLGAAFEPILDYLPPEKYYALLGRCAAGLFNNERQQALANVNALTAMGAKVYVRRGGALWNAFAQNGTRLYHDIAGAGRLPFEQFLAPEPGEAAHNLEAMRAYLNPARMAEQWRPVFEDAQAE